jgi:hypothetical protein
MHLFQDDRQHLHKRKQRNFNNITRLGHNSDRDLARSLRWCCTSSKLERIRLWTAPTGSYVITTNSSPQKSAFLMVVSFPSEAVCNECKADESPGVRRVGPKCVLRNRGLGFGKPPVCGDWAPRKTSKPPDAPQS